jgi:hypothetical protein
VINSSPVFQAALRGPHVLAANATAYPPTGDPVFLPVEDGSVTVDRTAAQRRQLSLTIADASFYPLLPTDPVNVYGTEIIVERGITFANNATETLLMGVFRVDTIERALPGGGLVITGTDRSSQIADARFTQPRHLQVMQATDLIQLLIGTVQGDAVYDIQTTDTTIIPKHVVQQDRWGEVQRVAQVIGCDVYPTEDGTWRIIDVPDPTTLTPVWQVDAGPTGVLISADDTMTRVGAPNIVVAQGRSVSGNNNPVQSQFPHGYDNDPLSPTYYQGAYGAVPVFYQSNHIRNQAQADRVADAQLADHIGASRTINFNTIPNPALDAGDMITITRPDGTSENHIIDALTIPLSPSGEMTGETRVVDWGAS